MLQRQIPYKSVAGTRLGRSFVWLSYEYTRTGRATRPWHPAPQRASGCNDRLHRDKSLTNCADAPCNVAIQISHSLESHRQQSLGRSTFQKTRLEQYLSLPERGQARIGLTVLSLQVVEKLAYLLRGVRDTHSFRLRQASVWLLRDKSIRSYVPLSQKSLIKMARASPPLRPSPHTRMESTGREMATEMEMEMEILDSNCRSDS